MQTHKKLTARLLSLVMSIAMITTMTSATVFAAGGDAPLGRSGVGVSSIGTIQSFDKLEDRFEPSTGEGAADHVYGLAVELNTPVEDLNLPDALTAMVARSTTTEQETIPVTWKGDKEYKSDANGKFVYTAVLPEGYILADGVQLPQIYVLVGRQARAAGDAISVTINDTIVGGGATLKAAVEANGGATDVTSLKITAGKVTTDDWKYLENLKTMTTFEIARVVTPVEPIPDAKAVNPGESIIPIFPRSIVSVTVPQAITIGMNAFEKCELLESVDFPAATKIGETAFRGCKALTTADFPNVTSTDMQPFFECTALTTATFPLITSINNYAFYGCTALTTATFPVATTINESAFSGCAALTSASFPKVTSIGNKAFKGCAKLATLKLCATPPTVGSDGNTFDDCPATRALVYVDADGKDLAGDALKAAVDAYKAVATDGKWNGWKVEPPKISLTATIGGVETTLSGDSLEAVLEGKESTVTSLKITAGKMADNNTDKVHDWMYLKELTALTNFEIASGVTVDDMPYQATKFPISIVSVTVPQEVKIDNYAFEGCEALTTVSFPEATEIGAGAFRDCSLLETASFPKVTKIFINAFDGCSSLETASFPNVQTIAFSAFKGCAKLATLKLGATLPTTVVENAFDGCPETRDLGYVDAEGNDLTGGALTNAQAAYSGDSTTGAVADGKWYGWTIGAVVSGVCEIGSKQYATLTEAVADVKTGETIKMLENITLKNVVPFGDGKSVTLDLNGKSITDGGMSAAIITAYGGGSTLIVTDSAIGGKITSSGSVTLQIGNSAASSDHPGSANFVLTGGTVENTKGTTGGQAIANYGTGTITLSGGTVSSKSTGKFGTIHIKQIRTDAPKTMLTITGGTVSNTASPEAYSVYFANAGITSNNLSDYYSRSGGTVGKVYPEAIITYTPVAGITGIPTTTIAKTPLTLTGVVAPTNATNSTIVWSVKSAGATGATISGSTLNTTAAGTVTVTATIVNGMAVGTDFAKDVVITVNPVGTVLYTITFNANGGSVSPATATTDAAGKLSGLPTPTRAGYTSNGWFTAASGGTSVTTTTVFTQDSTVYAQWTKDGGGGGGDSGGSSSPAPSNTIYSAEGSKGASNVISQAIKNAIATGGTNVSTSATFNNFDFLAPDGLKTINEIAAKESAGKTVNFTVNFDAGPKEPVNSRITVNPAALAKELTAKNITGTLPLGVWFDQAKDTKVQSVNTLFGKHFSNKIVSVVYDRNSTLAVNAEFCAKLNLAKTFGTDKNLYFYTYDNTTNTYKRILLPGYRVDKNGYAHITAPFGGSIIISDKPLTGK